jgi:hypothetical protein
MIGVFDCGRRGDYRCALKLALYLWGMGADRSSTARGILTRSPSGMLRRAISPGEGFSCPSYFPTKWRNQTVLYCVIERTLFHRACSASKKDSWLRPPSPWLFQKQSHGHLLSFNPGPAEGLDDLPSQYLRHFYQRKSIHHFDSANHI